MQKLRKEIQAAVRGELKTTADAAQPSFESTEAMVRLLTSKKRRILIATGEGKFESVLKLAGILRKKGRKPLPIELLSR